MLAYLILGITFLVLATLALLITKVRYHIGETFLRIRILGITVRKIPLTDIRRISKHRPEYAEKWPNTFKPRKRVLYIERRNGLIRHVMITPPGRYAFKAQLKQAVAKARERASMQVEPELDRAEDELSADNAE